jgi:hemerythrin-like domain-containing protein
MNPNRLTQALEEARPRTAQRLAEKTVVGGHRAVDRFEDFEKGDLGRVAGESKPAVCTAHGADQTVGGEPLKYFCEVGLGNAEVFRNLRGGAKTVVLARGEVAERVDGEVRSGRDPDQVLRDSKLVNRYLNNPKKEISSTEGRSMNPIQVLMDEHRKIEKVLSSLDRFAGEVQKNLTLDGRGDLSKFVEIIAGYADRKHHGKEEEILFAEMAKAGFPREAGPLAVMLGEHEDGRRQVGILRQLSQTPAVWNSGERDTILRAAATYTSLLRQHIQKEDHVLYPMAQGRLTAETWSGIESRFTAFEKQENESGVAERLLRLWEELTTMWKGIECGSALPSHGCCGCH